MANTATSLANVELKYKHFFLIFGNGEVYKYRQIFTLYNNHTHLSVMMVIREAKLALSDSSSTKTPPIVNPALYIPPRLIL